jgi:hypothetical protein
MAGNILRTFPRNCCTGTIPVVVYYQQPCLLHIYEINTYELVFGRDDLLNTKFEADWAFIKQRKQEKTKAKIYRENSGQIKQNHQENGK